MKIHSLIKIGDVKAVAKALSESDCLESIDPRTSHTPLMTAAESPQAGVDMLQLLLDRGADINAVEKELHKTVLAVALQKGSFDKVKFLLDAGADVKYKSPHGYSALINVMHKNIRKDKDLIRLVKLLIELGADLNSVSSYSESALNISSDNGRFDVVKILLDAGANPAPLQWNELMLAIVFGSLDDVKRLVAKGADLSAKDFWERTPWLLSLQVGDIEKSKFLLASGANRQDRGRCGKTSLMYAITNEHISMLKWLITENFDINAADDFSNTVLMFAVEHDAVECVKILLDAGAKIDDVVKTSNKDLFTDLGQLGDIKSALEGTGIDLDEMKDLLGDIGNQNITDKVISRAQSVDVVNLLLKAGADLNDIDNDMRALLTGVDSNGDLVISKEKYDEGRLPRFGTSNPEIMNIDFWKAMIQCGANAYQAKSCFGEEQNMDYPVWCFDRFGKSITIMPDGRIIEIAGEHEDSYDPDFYIYNDVIVHQGAGNITIYGYPKEVFPPTDFHTATLVGNDIYIIGGLGYAEERACGQTPVYRLDCKTFKIEKVATSGENPGWINRHKAVLKNNMIHITGGKLSIFESNKEQYVDNKNAYSLNLENMKWKRI